MDSSQRATALGHDESLTQHSHFLGLAHCRLPRYFIRFRHLSVARNSHPAGPSRNCSGTGWPKSRFSRRNKDGASRPRLAFLHHVPGGAGFLRGDSSLADPEAASATQRYYLWPDCLLRYVLGGRSSFANRPEATHHLQRRARNRDSHLPYRAPYRADYQCRYARGEFWPGIVGF